MNMRFNRGIMLTGKSMLNGGWIIMLAHYIDKSIQNHLDKNTSKQIKFVKNLHEMADNIRTINISDRELPCEGFNLA